MLGTPCFPCCAGCTDESIQGLHDSIIGSSCSVTIGAGMLAQQAATLTGVVSMANDLFGVSSSQALASALQLRYYKHGEQLSGDHDLALDLSATGTYMLNGSLQAQARYIKQTASYSIALTVYLGGLGLNPQVFFSFPGSQCLASVEVDVRVFSESAQYVRLFTDPTSSAPAPQGTTTVQRPLPYLVNGNQLNASLTHVNAPYFFKAISGTNNAYSVRDGESWAQFGAAWDADYKPSSLQWGTSEAARYVFYASLSESTGGSLLRVHSGAVSGLMFSTIGRWGGADGSSGWVSGIDFDSTMAVVGSAPAFRITYSPASSQYAFTQVGPMPSFEATIGG